MTIHKVRKYKKIILIGSVAEVTEEQGSRGNGGSQKEAKKFFKKKDRAITRERVLLAIICLPGLIMIRLKPD